MISYQKLENSYPKYSVCINVKKYKKKPHNCITNAFHATNLKIERIKKYREL